MKQITRDLYTSGRVWLSLSHSFSQKNTKSGSEFDLVKVNGDFVTLNAGAIFVLSLWDSNSKNPAKFYIPEYKIEELKRILLSMQDLKSDEKYVKDNELTSLAKPSTLYYRLSLNSGSYIDIYFVENDFNGDKSVNIAIECESKSYSLYDSNVSDLIDVIPDVAEISRYKQSAAELYYLETFLLKSSASTSDSDKPEPVKKTSEPRTVTKVDRTSVARTEASVEVPDKKKAKSGDIPEQHESTEQPKEETKTSPKAGYNYEDLLKDE